MQPLMQMGHIKVKISYLYYFFAYINISISLQNMQQSKYLLQKFRNTCIQFVWLVFANHSDYYTILAHITSTCMEYLEYIDIVILYNPVRYTHAYNRPRKRRKLHIQQQQEKKADTIWTARSGDREEERKFRWHHLMEINCPPAEQQVVTNSEFCQPCNFPFHKFIHPIRARGTVISSSSLLVMDRVGTRNQPKNGLKAS